VDSREVLLTRLESMRNAARQGAPETAVGWYLRPYYVDRLNLDHPSGVHERSAFHYKDGTWQESVLVP
jgi:pyridoxine/pyridoxamine 5'-phosphate oxidase